MNSDLGEILVEIHNYRIQQQSLNNSVDLNNTNNNGDNTDIENTPGDENITLENIKTQEEIDTNYDRALKFLNKGIFCDFIVILIPTIIVGGMLLGFPWFKVSYNDKYGVEICTRNIQITKPTERYNKSIETQESIDARELTTRMMYACLLYSVLVFLDSLLLLPVYIYKKYKSIIFEVILYLLEWTFIIAILCTFKRFNFYPQSIHLKGCEGRNIQYSEVSLFMGFYFLVLRVVVFKTIRIALCIKCVFNANRLLRESNWKKKEF
ncbi:hypothetical protein DICPUDRAFT_91698 [Dictyostelium purpureum]|uniref:Uncharacterized protein n=1 Tax=Dictyostelium purpureum TaxID=5786 RepID=F0ZG58_DICPU|nr:uncharacterized protein DICPUDRAFT_91698 [Dictyostelium purpureum]EGC37064.1 hypothetical protein DICPUDRAFT_91698 [Dictyostelium purpureum]|eukprot:XP_003286421.1 hypothetical protein DICPUDRAFT_91698 [Dictyostelium purpureum]